MSEEVQGCGYTEDYCRRGYGCVLLIAALVSVVASFTALVLCSKQENDIKDGISWAIGILGALLTFSVAWSVWQVIDTKNTVKKAEEASEKLKKLEQNLAAQQNLFNQRNLEIRHLIDAHARLHEAENECDLSYKYVLYAEAIRLLIQSNMDMTYEQFENARHGLFDTLRAFQSLADDDKIEDFINSEREYERYYQLLMSLLTKQSEEIDKFKQQLARIRELRSDAIEAMKNSKVGKRIKRRSAKHKKRMQEEEKRLLEKKAARQSAEANGNPS